MVSRPEQWRWSSYRATAGQSAPPDYLSIDWLLGQFGRRLHDAQKKYRLYVAEGIGTPSPWGQLQGQIYLGSKDFVREHQPDRLIREIPREQTRAHRPDLKQLLGGKKNVDHLIREAYRRYGYRMAEIAEHLDVHYSTVSRRLKRAEKGNV
jgi:putative transposase